MGLAAGGPRRRDRAAARHRPRCHGGRAVRRTASPRGARPPARRGVGHHHARRTDEPPRHHRCPLARRAHPPPLAGRPGRAPRRHPRPVVPRRGLDDDLGGPRRDGRRLRGRVRRLRPPARRAGPAGRRGRGQAAEPHAQGARLAATRGAGAHLEAEVPDRCGQCAHRRRAPGARHRRARVDGDLAARQGRVRDARPRRRIPGRGRRSGLRWGRAIYRGRSIRREQCARRGTCVHRRTRARRGTCVCRGTRALRPRLDHRTR